METTNIINDITGKRQLTLRRMCVEITEGVDAGLRLEFDRDYIQIGSHEDSDLRLKDDTVSRSHAAIIRTPDGILLRDLKSTNGTFVGEVRIREVYLADGGLFRVGLTTMRLTALDETIEIVPTAETHFEKLVGISVAMREVFTVLERVAHTDLTVLITGETGTGKELASAAIHARSKRKRHPFVVFDCASVPPNLVESELFGHERGAFTGAVAPRAGLFEQADGGTIFIDELGELPLHIQPALLRVLEQREIRRVGGRQVRSVDVRVVAATNRSLQEEIAHGRFREDLYYRLAVVETHLPPLRNRKEDFSLLIAHLLDTAPMEHEVTGVDPAVLRIFESWHWPGNVRELRNTLLRAIPFCDGPRITLQTIPDALRAGKPREPELQEKHQVSIEVPGADIAFKQAKERMTHSFERHYLEDLLERADGNLSRAARLAGVDRKTVFRMMKRHKMDSSGTTDH
jgi:DNA-binding NtrC family response regulator